LYLHPQHTFCTHQQGADLWEHRIWHLQHLEQWINVVILDLFFLFLKKGKYISALHAISEGGEHVKTLQDSYSSLLKHVNICFWCIQQILFFFFYYYKTKISVVVAASGSKVEITVVTQGYWKKSMEVERKLKPLMEEASYRVARGGSS